MFRRNPTRAKTILDASLFNKHPEILIKNDLIDCGIDICSLEVLALFQENFDYQNTRIDFLHGILGSELVDRTIYCHTLRNGYAAKATTLQMYHSITSDILKRWVYPITPEIFSIDNKIYRHYMNNIYKGENVFLERHSFN
jgi:translation initiation factor eIF-2B subunit epsilon